MKPLNLLAAGAAVFSTAFALSADDIASETRDVRAFEKVRLEGSMDVRVTAGSAQSVTVNADADIIEFLRTEVKGKELIIDLEYERKHRKLFRRVKKMEIIITVPKLTSAEVHGSGDMMIEGVKSDHFDIEVHGSGDAVLEQGVFDIVDIEVHGSGDVEISGSCDEVNVELQGSGDIEASKLKCQSADVAIHGSGDVAVYSEKKASVEVHGSGDVTVFGKPEKIESRVNGSGDIRVR